MPHNGKKIQTNPSFPYVGVDWPFLNILKGASAWFYGDHVFPEDVSLLSDDGYPLTDPIPHSGLYMQVSIPTQTQRAGNYVLKWTGGSVSTSLNMQCKTTGDTSFTSIITGTGANGRFTITPNTTNDIMTLGLTVTGSPPISNLRCCHADDETALDGGAVFGVKFKQLMGECGLIRFLDWQYSNGTNISKWAHRKPLTFYNYNANYYPAALMVTSTNALTSSTGDAFTVAKTGFSLIDKAQVILRFDHTVSTPESALPTLNVNSTGAKALKNYYGLYYNGSPVFGGSNAPYSLATYDQALDCWLLHNGQYDRYGIMAGVPPEICLQLCIEVGAHPWFCAPYLACDCGTGQLPTLSDYMSSLATYCLANQPAWMKVYYETPNETWNSGTGFFATRYAWAKQSLRMGEAVTTQNHETEWIGTVGSLIGQAVSTVYGADHSKYAMVIGYAAYTGSGYPPDSGEAVHRLNSTWYVSHGGSAANNWATHICYANYFNPWYYQTSKWLTLAYQYNAAGTQAAKDALADEYLSSCTVWDSVGDSGGFPLPMFQPRVTAFASYAATKSKTVCHYEGGYSPDFWTFDGWTSITGITRGTTTVITLSSSVYNLVKQNALWDCAVPGMQIRIDGVGGTTGLNGNTYTVAASPAPTPFTLALTVNSSGMGAYTSGGTITYMSMQTNLNTLQAASKFRSAVTTHTVALYEMLETAGSEFPSEYSFAGAGSPFTIWDPDIYVTPTPPRWLAVEQFNDATPTEPTTPATVAPLMLAMRLRLHV